MEVYESLERACALLEGSGQEMIDACAVKAKPSIRKNAEIVTERDIRYAGSSIEKIMGVPGSKGQRENVKIWPRLFFVMALIRLRVP